MWHNRVIWSEGLFLRPQHFQQQERSLYAAIEQKTQQLSIFPWGFSYLELDESALSLGVVQINKAAGILPDGTSFSIPDRDAAPQPFSVPASIKEQTIFLVTPLERPGVPSVSLDDETSQSNSKLARYLSSTAQVADYCETIGEASDIQLARLRLSLVAQTELGGGFSAVGAFRVIERKTSGTVALDASFIVPSLCTNSNRILQGYLQMLLGLLKQRAQAIASRMSQPGKGGVSEIADFLLLQTVNKYCALFAHLQTLSNLHPEQFYRTLVEMAGELSTFSPERLLATEFPSYRHDDLRATFAPVMTNLRLYLSMVLEQTAIQLPMENRQHGVRTSQISDLELLKTAQFVLAVNAKLPAEVLRTRFPTQVKIGPATKLRDLVNLQLPGVSLRALPAVPRQIPFHAGFTYFELDTKHDMWRSLLATGDFSMHVAGDFPDLELEFWAIRANSRPG
jgi:type VI secretion system protein ImpJ